MGRLEPLDSLRILKKLFREHVRELKDERIDGYHFGNDLAVICHTKKGWMFEFRYDPGMLIESFMSNIICRELFEFTDNPEKIRR